MMIKDIIGIEYELSGCLGCEIVNQNLNPVGGILYKNEYFVVAQDFELPIDGFIVISSIRHVEQLAELSDKERMNLIDLINKTINILKSNNIAEEYNIILEEKCGYHFHVWLMPRHKWMQEKFGKVMKHIKEIQEYAIQNMQTKENVEKIIKTCEMVRKELNK